MEPTIRLATVADLAIIHRIEMSSYSDPWPRSIFFLMQSRTPEFFLVADVEGTIVGYSIGEIELRENDIVGHVINIAVKKDWRRRGLAERLLNELEERFLKRQAKFSYLEVRLSNMPAKKLYKKHGYADVTQLPGYYREENGLRMEKTLS